jgi:hypothetical protein
MSTSWKTKLKEMGNKYFEYSEEYADLKEEVTIISELLEEVEYSLLEAAALTSVGESKLGRLNTLHNEMFVCTQLMEVYSTQEKVGKASLTVH